MAFRMCIFRPQRWVPLLPTNAARPLHASCKIKYTTDKDKDSSRQLDKRVGSVPVHRHHIVVCNSASKEWPSRVEGMSETITALARGAIRLPGRAMVTLSDFAPLHKHTCACATPSNPLDSQIAADKYRRVDVAVFPLGLVAKQLDLDGVEKLLSWLSHDVLPTSWSPDHSKLPRPTFEHTWLELSKNRHIFVCTHGTRDYLCGHHGGKLLDDLRALIIKRRLQKHVAAWSTSHIGGHKYAANAIVYPRGDWYGTWCDKCGGDSATPTGLEADDAAILDASVHNITWWDAWRGAISMSKKDQIATWTRNVGHVNSTGNENEDESVDTIASWTPAIRKRNAVGK
ncbi:hypothetical protein H4S08_004075 [Coemansia sp. RSA 1365]|nr:hypothetical protein H4S08_004075 [Coemansia sp. RSA 1365]